MRVLAKFIGFIVARPYQYEGCRNTLVENRQIELRNMVSRVLLVLNYVYGPASPWEAGPARVCVWVCMCSWFICVPPHAHNHRWPAALRLLSFRGNGQPAAIGL